jgi:diguanylate cyclase (GGDEF)-like protein
MTLISPKAHVLNGPGTLVANSTGVARLAASRGSSYAVNPMAGQRIGCEDWLFRMNVASISDFTSMQQCDTSLMNSFGTSIRILSPEQRRQLLEVHHQVAASAAPHEVLRQLATLIGGILQVKAAFVGQADGHWAVLAESRVEPRLPDAGAAGWMGFDRVASTLKDGVHAWSHNNVDWTLIELTGRAGVPGILMLEGDWTLCAAPLLDLAQSLFFAERALASSSQARIGVATHRLTRTLGRVTGLREVCTVVLRHVVRALPSRLAAFAVPTEDEHLAIVATHGYPLDLVERVRIAPGSGVIGSVYTSGVPLCVPDVTVFPGLQRRRPRYRTNSFVALPVSAGSEVLGVVCVTDRLDNGAFTRDDVSTLRALAAPAALALARERATREANAFAHAAIVDPLSGLFNRRYFHERLEEELQRAQRHKTPVGLLMIDIDDFKSINDRFGHVAGDTVIRGVSDILRRSVRKFDLCTRFGGEEFAIVMPGSGPENSTSVAERIRQRIEAFQPEEPGLADLRVTASIGLSFSHDMSARELIDRADQALYAAKRAGKNRVIG